MLKKNKRLSESEIIAHLSRSFPSSHDDFVGIGDDAAIIKTGGDKAIVITKDLMVEDVHFRLKYYDARAIAHKAVHTNLSDLAAMGAKPRFLLLGISIPKTIGSRWIKNFSSHLSKICRKHDVILIGGDTTASKKTLFISITAIGTADESKLKYRSSSCAGDVICLTGVLGKAYAGLVALEKGVKGFESLKKRQLFPQSKVQEGLFLASSSSVRAMMDISDGLFVDLNRLCLSSNAGARIQLEKIKVSKDLKSSAKALGIDPLKSALTGGEDYELLFTVSKKDVDGLQNKFFKRFKYNFFKIGEIINGRGIAFKENDRIVDLKLRPSFSHFGEM